MNLGLLLVVKSSSARSRSRSALTMVRFKVRPRKDQVVLPCALELSSLLNCFATTGDLRAVEGCAISAKALHACMASQSKTGGKPSRGSINHLLGKLK